MKGYENPQLLTTPHELEAALKGDRKPLVIDVRSAEDFAAGHIPGAVHLDLWGLSLVDTDPAPLGAFMWIVDHLFNLRGVDASTPVVVYEEQSGMRAARAFWFLDYLGHQHVQVLDGGLVAWMHAGLPVTRDAAPPPKSTWTGTPRPEAIAGAVHVEWTRNLGPDGAFRPAAELRKMYEAAGVTPDKEVITYCQGGYRAAHGYLALRLLGYPRVRNYTGSWKEWGDREDLPVETPNAP